MADTELEDSPSGIDACVGRKIRERRRHLGISQPRLAATLGLSYQQLQKYEQGVNRLAASRLAVTATALDVPPGYFFVTAVPDQIPHAFELACLAAAQAASEAASELVHSRGYAGPGRWGARARLVDAARIVAELASRSQEAELLVAIHRWNADHT